MKSNASRHRIVVFRAKLLGALAVSLASSPAIAGEEVVYEPVPNWVEEAQIKSEARQDNSPIVLLDQQARIDDGQLWTYLSTAIALDSPQALTQFGTVSATWLPDKGDLIVHSVELIRDGDTIDLLEEGAEFEVLRREQGLESRLLNGALTATMNVPGAQLGDIIRLSYSTTLSDQAMGESVQWQSPLLAKPFPLADGRVSISWPRDLEVSRIHRGDAEIAEPLLEGDFYTWSVELPLEELDPVPQDSPGRYQLGELLQVSTYSSWAEVSQNMARHYDPSGTVTPGGGLAQKINEIAAASDDPMVRAVTALQFVQDDISYLLNGLDGGNYLPQSPEETWENRFGDCKAKSLLLLAMLRELGVEAELVLVTIQGGDALPLLAPMPGNFDHMIVRAVIDGTNYWLDGTSGGTRIDTVDEVPRFYFALPLRAEGAELMPLDIRPQSTPDRIVRLTIDQSAGVRLPSLFEVEVEFRGKIGAQWRTIVDQAEGEMRDDIVSGTVTSILGNAALIDRTVDYDADTGVATLTARGIRTTQWSRDRSQYELTPPAQAARDVAFNVDRARAAWREIPLNLNGPIYYASELEVLLPSGEDGFEMEGTSETAEVIGGVELSSRGNLEGNRFTLSQTMRSIDTELAAADIALARRSLNRFDRSLPTLRTTGPVRELWEYFGEDRRLLEPYEDFYAQAITEAEPDNNNALLNRARFRAGVFDHEGALADAEAAYAIEASRSLYLLLASLRRETGDLEGALEELRMAEDLEPNAGTYGAQIEILALLGRAEEGLELADEYRAIVDDRVGEADILATALGWSGAKDEGLGELQSLVDQRPGDGRSLNALCWYTGIWDQMTEDRLSTCVEAVEKSDYSAQALDSRALAHFRLGNLDAALADINAALVIEPAQAESRLLRGIIRLAQGDESGSEDVALALAIRPSLRATYEAWGLEF